MANIAARGRNIIYDYSAYNFAANIPLEGERVYFNTILTGITNPCSVLGDGTSQCDTLPFLELINIKTGVNIDISILEIEGNIVLIENTSASEITITAGTAHILPGNKSKILRYDGSNWNDIPGIKSVKSLSADTTIGDNDNYKTYLCNGGVNGIIITLPTPADNTDKILEFIKTDSNNSVIKIIGEGAETIAGLDFLFLTYQYQRIKILCDGSNWYVLEGKQKFRTGMISRSDWTNVHLGSIALDYDNLSGTFQIGEIITGGTSGDTGIIIADDGSTLNLIMVTSGGVFQNNEEITGSWSGATADVDEVSGSVKDIDCDFIHNQEIDLINYCHTIQFIVSSDGTYNNSSILTRNSYTGVGAMYGYSYFQIDNNSFKIQTATDGLKQMADDGTTSALASDDIFYEIIFERNF